MKTRISSRVVMRGFSITAAAITTTILSTSALAQSGPGYYTDPATGIVYRQVAKTIETPVVETKMVSQEQTVFTPKTVHETRPENRTVYTPITENVWQPRVTGRWNPFQQPTVAYEHVPQTRWEARNEVVQRTQSKTQWIPETRKVDVPQQIVRMDREQKVEYEAIGRVAPQPTTSGVSDAIAARLRPLESDQRVEPMGANYAQSPTYTAPRIAATTVGRMTSDPPRRTIGQSGMAATDLMPTPSATYGQALAPNTGGGVGVANLPALPFFR
ncbi:hypothetical protein Poly51_31650 [Rubripirellula tenax]|uniref:Secreted protein n=1 Tax=Rubripirellula tenax TaxID=2528015 RepID=A0A5C6F323_9BACT|nr:hypothetical protein [Rubripirellula tenax]TWU54446.1 hypothetical protein Poly51_31650 [Rubripirellula tenax]